MAYRKAQLSMQVVGNIGKIETRENNGNKVCNISVAADLSYKNQEGTRVEKTQWVNCAAWGGFGEMLSRNYAVGNKIFLEGTPKPRAYLQNGEPAASLQMTVTGHTWIGGNSDNQQSAPSAPTEEEIPF